MRKWIETTGRSEEDAIAAALFQLGLDRDDVSVEVIERAKSGFLGFGGNPAKVRVSYEVPGEEETPAAEEVKAPVEEPKPVVEAPKAAPAASGSGETVSSPMPGTILDVKVAAGQAVKSGDILFILEAMKMENEIFAPCDGTVSSVAVSKGAAVNPGDVLCVIG